MILMNDFKAEPVELRREMQAAVARVIESGWYVLGEECKRFERQWADACGVGHGVGVANGMDAIEIALRAAGIGEGDEVITTPMTAFATVLAILRTGAVPVLADIDPETALLSPDSVRRCVTGKTRAMVLVHLYGQVRNMQEWESFCSSAGILLVEDCAQSHLASMGSRAAGSFGKVSAFSFYPTKNLGALGDGGMLVTGDHDIADKARVLRNYGQSERYHHPVIGLNSRLDEIQAAILGARLGWLRPFLDRRRAVAEAYQQGIRHPQVSLLAPPTERDAHVWHLFVIRSERRDALSAHLRDKGVQSLIHYPIPVHRQPPCADLRRDPSGLAASEEHARLCLSLPCHPQMTDADVGQVVAAVNSFKG
jgi:dTDP-4-amino-4,6-dideoxygalactose transaminase